jgi:hypothetical protein
MIAKNTKTKIDVPPDVEELATWWADIELTDFG